MSDAADATRDKLRRMLLAGELDARTVEVDVAEPASPSIDVMTPQGMEEVGFNLKEMFQNLMPRKTRKRMPIVLFGTKYWGEVINFDALVKSGTISPGDLDIFHRTDSLDDAYDIITQGLTENALAIPGPVL